MFLGEPFEIVLGVEQLLFERFTPSRTLFDELGLLGKGRPGLLEVGIQRLGPSRALGMFFGELLEMGLRFAKFQLKGFAPGRTLFKEL